MVWRVVMPPSFSSSDRCLPSLHRAGDPRVDAGIVASAASLQSLEVVPPSVRVLRGGIGVGKITVSEVQQGAVAVALQLEDHGGGPGRHGTAATWLPPPREDEPPRWMDFHELAARHVVRDHL